MMLCYKNGLHEISSFYDYFLIDLWGVVHNGQTLFPGVNDCLGHLEELQKKIVFLTNSPRPGTVLKQNLEQMDLILNPKSYFVYSSGDACIDELKEKWTGKICYFLGDAGFHESLAREIPGPVTHQIEEADYILLSGLPPSTESILNVALQGGIPLICANPDKAAIHGSTKVACPGSIAHAYEEQGGTVYYFGKPYSPIYHKVLSLLNNPDKKRVVAIGDGLFTDIQGANQQGIDSVFIQSGLHQELALDHIHNMCQKHQLNPTYMLESFSL